MDGFCFTIPFIDLYSPFPDLQDDTLNRSDGAALTRETSSHRIRYPSEVVNCFLGTNGYSESVFPGGNVSALHMSSAESLGRHHHMEIGWFGSHQEDSCHSPAPCSWSVSVWDQGSSQM